MKIACIGYRKWALDIYDQIVKKTDHDFMIVRTKKEYDKQDIINYHPDLVLFYGWSWKIDPEIFKNFKSIMLHPSDLPKFRGGTPIQNQIINGVIDSKVTLFLIDEEYDAGDILVQEHLSLEGHMHQILDRITKAGVSLTLKIFKEGLKPTTQDNSKSTYYSRRKMPQSEITLEELLNKPGIYLYNKIRMLEDPYPNAFIKTSDGKKLVIKIAELENSGGQHEME